MWGQTLTRGIRSQPSSFYLDTVQYLVVSVGRRVVDMTGALVVRILKSKEIRLRFSTVSLSVSILACKFNKALPKFVLTFSSASSDDVLYSSRCVLHDKTN